MSICQRVGWDALSADWTRYRTDHQFHEDVEAIVHALAHLHWPLDPALHQRAAAAVALDMAEDLHRMTPTAEEREARELLRQVVLDYTTDHCPDGCQCSAARARRYLARMTEARP